MVVVFGGIAISTLPIDSVDSSTPVPTLDAHKDMKVGGSLVKIERLVGMGMG